MISDTFFYYLTRKDILSVLPTSAKNKTEEQLENQFFKEVNEKKISSTKARNLWIKAMQNLFSQEFQRFYNFTPSTKYDSSTKLKNDLHKFAKEFATEENKGLSSATTVKMNSSPVHYLYAVILKEKADFLDLMKASLDSLLLLSVIPELGIVSFWPTAKDAKYKFINKVLKATFKGIEEIKVNALLLRKFAVQENITKLGISTPQEIAGFAGLDVIEFRGSNVMLGLSGLKRRHDANVDVITRVGPFTEVESDDIRLVCGKGIQSKTYEGIEALLRTLKAS